MATIPFGTRRTRRWIPWLSISIPTIGWLVFGLYPSLATAVYSFTQYSGLPGTPLNWCGLCNYRNAFNGSFSDFSAAVRPSHRAFPPSLAPRALSHRIAARTWGGTADRAPRLFAMTRAVYHSTVSI